MKLFSLQHYRHFFAVLTVLGVCFSAFPLTVPVAGLNGKNGPEVWGCVVASQSGEKGMVHFSLNNPADISALGNTSSVNANGGASYIGNVMYYLGWVEFLGNPVSYIYRMDTETWKSLGKDYVNNRFIALDLTTDPVSGLHYGVFNNDERALSSMEFGAIDYSAMTRETIAPLNVTLLAVAADNAGDIYAIGEGGMLYSVDKVSGGLTAIGSTGIEIGMDIQSMAVNPEDNQLYWAALRADRTTGLYKVDKTTGAATLIADFPHGEQLTGLRINPYRAALGAPDVVSSITPSFTDGSLQGTVSFTAPDITYGGQPLTGELTYTVKVNGESAAVGSATPGERVSADVTVPGDGGETRFDVFVTNTEGDGPSTYVTDWVGYDIPSSPSRITVDFDKETHKVSLSWRPSSYGQHDGYVDVDNYRFNITRYPGAVRVAEGISERSFFEILPDGKWQYYYYTVSVMNGSRESDARKSEPIRFGSALDVPFAEDFENPESLNSFTVLDENEDSKTWTAGEGDVYYKPNSRLDADDWLILPPLELKTDRSYIFSFVARPGEDGYGEYVAAALSGLANGEKARDFANVIISSTRIYIGDGQLLTAEVRVSEAGAYRFGIHAVSGSNGNRLYVDNISVTEGSTLTAPGPASDFTVKAGRGGSKEAILTFTTPVKQMNGQDDIEGLDHVDIYRGTELIHTVDGVAVGQTCSYTDRDASYGYNTYSVVAYDASGAKGQSAEATGYVGFDSPKSVENFKLTLKEGNTLAFDWSEVSETGVKGGFVDVPEVSYIISQPDGVQVAELKGTTHHEITLENDDERQNVVYYFIKAVNEYGESPLKSSNRVITGVPVQLPVHESFDNGSYNNDFWWSEGSAGSFNPTASFHSEQTEGGCAHVMLYDPGDRASLNTGKISLASAENPTLRFKFYSFNYYKGSVAVEVIDDKDNSTEVFSALTTDNSTGNDWVEAQVDLKPFKNSGYVIIKFHAVSDDSYIDFAFDDIDIFDLVSDNLTLVGLKMPENVKAGLSSEAYVKVANNGASDAEGFAVRLTDGDKIFAVADGLSLASGTSETYTLEFVAGAFDAGEVKVYAEIISDVDKISEDNISDEAVINVQLSEMPVISGLEATESDGDVMLSWTEADCSPVETVDDFEAYAGNSTENFGKWIVIDADRQMTTSIPGYSGYRYLSFMVYSPREAGVDIDSYPNYAPHSGDRCLAAVAPWMSVYVNDDWLISPALSGTSQTISFFARSTKPNTKDRFEVLSSSTGTEIEDFTLIETYYTDEAGWKEFTADIPEGSTHFAIRYCPENASDAFLLDDIRFTPEAPVFKQYNVYRDAVLLAHTETGSYKDTEAPEKLVEYNVTAVYEESGETGLSDTVRLDLNKVGLQVIEQTDIPDGPVYNLQGLRVAENLAECKRLPAGVYITNGMKFLKK